MNRFYRSTREAFPSERYPAIEHYSSPLLLRWWRPLSWMLFWGLWAFIGILLAWR